MKKPRYNCNLKKLHPDLRDIFHKKEENETTQIFLKKTNPWFSIKFICFIFFRVFGLKHYNTMGVLGYSSHLFDGAFAEKFLINKNTKKILDIGAGSGHITAKFSGTIKDISCLEPSYFFQKLLRKKGFKIVNEDSLEFYDIVTIFNVLDVCPNPGEIMKNALNHLATNGTIIVSIPFPIRIRHSNKKMSKNTLEQQQEIEFEKAVSIFYENFLVNHGLKVTFFTRIPYIVLLPEAHRAAVYDNGLFICQRV